MLGRSVLGKTAFSDAGKRCEACGFTSRKAVRPHVCGSEQVKEPDPDVIELYEHATRPRWAADQQPRATPICHRSGSRGSPRYRFRPILSFPTWRFVM
jgi:hypothetical protein